MKMGTFIVLKCLFLLSVVKGAESLQCPSCSHVTVTDVPGVVKSVVDSALGLFQDVKCSQELTGPTSEIKEETCEVQSGKTAKCSWYKGTLTMKIPLVNTEIPFHVSKRGCYYAQAAAVPANGCHDLNDLSEDQSALQDIIDSLTSVLNLHSFKGQRCLCSDTYCQTSTASCIGRVSLNFVLGSVLLSLFHKYM